MVYKTYKKVKQIIYKICKQIFSVAKNAIVSLLYILSFFLLTIGAPITIQSLARYRAMELQTHSTSLAARYGHMPKVLINRM